MKNVRNLTRIIPILVLFFIFGCQDDSLVETQQNETSQNKSSFNVSTIFKQDIQTNEKLTQKMTSLQVSKYNQIGKSVYNQTYDFTINTDVARYIDNNNNTNHSYTFTIDRANYTNSAIENLVFSYNELNDDYNAGLVTYHLTADQKQEYLASGQISTSFNVSFSSLEINIDDVLNKNQIPCTVTYEEFHQPHDSDNIYLHSVNGIEVNPCFHSGPEEEPCNADTIIIIDCPEGGGSGATGNTQDTSSNSPSNSNASDYSNAGGNTNSNQETTDVVTLPVISPQEEIESCLNSGFNSVAYQQLNSLHRDTIIEIRDFLNHTGCNEDTQNFIELAIDALANDIVEDLAEFVLENTEPDCESFYYSRVGLTNWQCAAVSGVHELFTILNWDCIGYDWGIFTQPLYFQLPINATFPQGFGTAQIESAYRLNEGFKQFDSWYQQHGCNAGADIMTTRLLDFIKAEFEEVGGTVTTTPPLGFSGTVTEYRTSWFGYGNC